MSTLVRAILVNILCTAGAGLLSLLIFSQALSIGVDVLQTAMWILTAMATTGLFFHAVFMERWLRPAERLIRSIETGLLSSDRQMGDLQEVAAFPVRSFLLTAGLWVLLIVVGVWQLKNAAAVGTYEIYVISAILLSVGAWAWILQLFLNRQMVTPIMERFLAKHVKHWRHDDPFFTQSLFPVRTKWIVLSLFLIGFATFVSIVFTASWVRNVAVADSYRMLDRRVDTVQSLVEDEVAGGMRFGEDAEREVTDRIATWLQASFWIKDRAGRILLSSDSGSLLQDRMRDSRVVSRKLDGGNILLAANKKTSELEAIIPFFWIFLLVLLLTGAAVSVVAILVGRDLTHSLRYLKNLTAGYDDGDFRQAPYIVTEDELGSIAEILGHVRALLTSVLSALRRSGEIFNESNDEILTSSRRLVHVAEEQKRTLVKMQGQLNVLNEQYADQFSSIKELEQMVSRSSDQATGSEDRFTELDKVASSMVDAVNRFGFLFEDILGGLTVHGDALQLWRETASNVRKKTDRILVHAGTAQEQAGKIHQTHIEREGMEEQQTLKQGRLIQNMRNIRKAIDGVGTLGSRVNDSMGDLSEALAWVNEIGDDTRLLSLNAAILSAKAAEDGRSFSVIAQNIAALADLSGETVQRLQDAIQRFSERATGLNLKVKSLNERYDELEGQRNELAGLDLNLHDIGHNMLVLDREITRLASFFSEKYTSLQSQLDSASMVLDSIKGNFANQKYRFEEMQMKLKDATGRISEIKSNTQYQMNRAKSVQDSLAKISLVIREVIGTATEHVDGMSTLSDVGDQIIAGIGMQINSMSDLEQMLQEFDNESRTFSADLNLYKLKSEEA